MIRLYLTARTVLAYAHLAAALAREAWRTRRERIQDQQLPRRRLRLVKGSA